MQEEVEQRVVTLAINCAKLTEQELKKALVKLLQHWKAHRQKGPHGKMTVKQLAAQNRGMQSVEVTDQNGEPDTSRGVRPVLGGVWANLRQ